MKIYVASSWRNPYQPKVVQLLQAEGHEVYDFRNPEPGDNGFHWSEIDPDWLCWTPAQFAHSLKHPVAREGFEKDYNAMLAADAFVLVLPCGRSAHLELGWAVGMGLPTAILLDDLDFEPELMYRMVDTLVTSHAELAHWAEGESLWPRARRTLGASQPPPEGTKQ